MAIAATSAKITISVDIVEYLCQKLESLSTILDKPDDKFQKISSDKKNIEFGKTKIFA